MYGSSIGGWIDIKDENKSAECFVISSSNKAKKGSNIYYTPTFEVFEPTEKEINEAKNFCILSFKNIWMLNIQFCPDHLMFYI